MNIKTNDYKSDPRVKSLNKLRYIPENLLTEEERIEIVKCKANYFYFIENFIDVPAGYETAGFIKFNPYSFQIRTIKAFMKYHNVLTFKSRQTGFSILWATFLLWAAIFHNNWIAGVVSKTGADAAAFLRKFYDILNRLTDTSPFLVPPVITKNVHSVRFGNKSLIVTGASSSNALRSETLSLLLLDEAAFNEVMEEIYTAAQPTLSTATAFRLKQERAGIRMTRPIGIIINSTPNGKKGQGRWYYEMYKGAKKKGTKYWNKFFLIRAHWRDVPDYNDEWYEHQCAELGWDPIKIAQEYDLKFVGDTSDIIPPDLLKQIIVKEIPLERIPISDKKPNELVNIYEEPKQECNYIIGVDNAWGDDMLGNDPDSSAFIVIEVETGTPVCTFKGRANALELAVVLNKVGRYYNNALMAVERAATGIDTIITLRDHLSYPNLYIHIKRDDTKVGSKTSGEMVYGFVTNKNSRPMMLSNVLAQLRNNIVLNDPELFEQIDFLEFKKGRLQASQGEHDDMVMAFAIALQVRVNVYKIRPGMTFENEEERIKNRELLLEGKIKEIAFTRSDKDISEERKILTQVKEIEALTGQKVEQSRILDFLGKVNAINARKNSRKFFKR